VYGPREQVAISQLIMSTDYASLEAKKEKENWGEPGSTATLRLSE
jgi:hypothetical protein